MLEPTERTVLTNSLRGPDGYRVDSVISLTYTLDLIALLTLPLTCTLTSGEGLNGDGRVDPIKLLEAVRRYADRILVFCEAGRIAVPGRIQSLFGFLEGSVHEVRAPKRGAFHPKLTIVRCVPDADDPMWADERPPDSDAVWYRLLCGTRNLTFDRSWDTMLALDGALATTRKLAISRNRPLSELIAVLPGLVNRPLDDRQSAQVALMADEILRVQFEPPAGFDQEPDGLRFWTLGLEGRNRWPFGERIDRFAIVSPFLSDGFLDRVSEQSPVEAVVSRPESIDQLQTATRKRSSRWLVLADAAETEAPDSSSPTIVDGEPPHDDRAAEAADNLPSGPDDLAVAAPPETELRGLHAKLFIADAGWKARIWTGSANATTAAFDQNVEFLVELVGQKSKLGIDALLSPSEKNNGSIRFGDMLVRYRPAGEPPTSDGTEERLEQLLETARRLLVESRLVGRVYTNPGGENLTYNLSIEPTVEVRRDWPGEVQCVARPLSLPPEGALPWTPAGQTRLAFTQIAYESLLGFCAFELVARDAGRALSTRFVLSVPLRGLDEDRPRRLLVCALRSREHLLRYLRMLLEGPDAVFPSDSGYTEGRHPDGPVPGAFDSPLLESLLKSLATRPERLAPVDQLVQDLEKTPEGRRLLPDEFLDVWESIRALRRMTKTEASGASR